MPKVSVSLEKENALLNFNLELISILTSVIKQHVSWRGKYFFNRNFLHEVIGCVVPSEKHNNCSITQERFPINKSYL